MKSRRKMDQSAGRSCVCCAVYTQATAAVTFSGRSFVLLLVPVFSSGAVVAAGATQTTAVRLAVYTIRSSR